MNEQQQLDFLDIISIMNFFYNLKGKSNDDLMKELQRQDREYLDKIMDDLKEIKKILKGDKK